MNPESFKMAKELFDFVSEKTKDQIMIAPPYLYLKDLVNNQNKKSKIKIIAQNVFWDLLGAYTGEISPLMIKKMGISGSIVGHSERRYILKEDDDLINKKIISLIKNDLLAVLCVGETHKDSLNQALIFIKNQLKKDLSKISNSINKISYLSAGRKNTKLIIAYEPVWSIGGGKPTDAERSALIIKEIKKFVKEKHGLDVEVLYGGSVDCKNISSFLKYKEIDGFLVGSASLKKSEISCIINKVAQNK